MLFQENIRTSNQQETKTSFKWSTLSRADIKAGVTQGLVLGPVFFFFFLYINDVTENLDSNPKLFEQHKK